MSRQSLAHDTRRTAPRDSRSHGQDTPPSPMTELAAAFMGVPWMKLWADAWTAWMAQCEANISALQPGDVASDERRHSALPWMPQFESKVIPFRRVDDKPGVEATKLSMRLRVPGFPWLAGSNIIAIDSVMPRTIEPSGDDAHDPERK